MSYTIKVGNSDDYQVVPPETEAEIVELGQRFSEYERSLPEAERLTIPPFAQMQAMAQMVKNNQETRTVARSARKLAVETRSAGVGPLYDRLQLACGLLIVLRFDGHVTNALEAWGFKVKQVIAAPVVEPPVPEPITT